MLAPMTEEVMSIRPHIMITAEPVEGLRSVDDLRDAVRSGRAGQVWHALLTQVDGALGTAPLTPSSPVIGRPPVETENANRDWIICHSAGQRVLCGALAAVVTGDRRYADDALVQIRALLDEQLWPDWRDRAHQREPIDLRTGLLAHDIALAYDWLHPLLRSDERQMIVAGLDTRAIRPFWEGVEANALWTERASNWMASIMGGLGVLGMCLGDDHPDAGRLVEYTLEKMEWYLEKLGPDGEFNEGVGYADVMRLPTDFFVAHRYLTRGQCDRLSQHPFQEAAYWYLYMTLPPGRIAAFGDAGRSAPPNTDWVAAVAAANRDSVLQWFALTYPLRGPRRALQRELLWVDDTLEANSPEGILPHGTRFTAHGACISSRTDWGHETTPMVVSSKAGIEREHEHHDAGQVCIDAYGEPMIVDLGSPPGYPADFFGRKRYNYYNASSRGHNVLSFGDREMSALRGTVAPLLGSEFDDERGGWWQIDLTGMYDGVRAVRRTVVHLWPAVCAVLDEALLEKEEDIALRWHTANRCVPSEDGSFTVVSGDVQLACRVVRVDGGGLRVRRGNHQYVEPFNRHRLGPLLEQRQESFVEVRARARECRMVSLFAAHKGDTRPHPWVPAPGAREIDTGDGSVSVCASPAFFEVINVHRRYGWRIPLSPMR